MSQPRQHEKFVPSNPPDWAKHAADGFVQTVMSSSGVPKGVLKVAAKPIAKEHGIKAKVARKEIKALVHANKRIVLVGTGKNAIYHKRTELSSSATLPRVPGPGTTAKLLDQSSQPTPRTQPTPVVDISVTDALQFQPTYQDSIHDSCVVSSSSTSSSLLHSRFGSAANDIMDRLFFPPDASASATLIPQGLSLGDESTSQRFNEAGLLGSLIVNSTSRGVFLNTSEPFCLATVGVQGSGKSHTIGVVLENCLLPCGEPSSRPLVRLQRPMSALVLHYDQNPAGICEATGLSTESPRLAEVGRGRWQQPRDKMIVLVSPSNYRQRKKFYGEKFQVKPLLFEWHTLSADHLKKIMRIKDTDQQLYVSSMLDLLRKYQRKAEVPKFGTFLEQVKAICNLPGQGAALAQRINLLSSLIYESEENSDLRAESGNILSSLADGILVVCDMTDPLLASDEVNGMFQVIVEQFRTAPRVEKRKGGRLLVLDEAHRYMDGTSTDGLSNAIVDAARLMRHDGLRLAVSTQSPKALAPELLELVSVAVLHRFHSRDWHTYLSFKIGLEAHHFEELMMLPPGEALAFVGRHCISRHEHEHVLRLRVRPRLTADRGASRINTIHGTATATESQRQLSTISQHQTFGMTGGGNKISQGDENEGTANTNEVDQVNENADESGDEEGTEDEDNENDENVTRGDQDQEEERTQSEDEEELESEEYEEKEVEAYEETSNLELNERFSLAMSALTLHPSSPTVKLEPPSTDLLTTSTAFFRSEAASSSSSLSSAKLSWTIQSAPKTWLRSPWKLLPCKEWVKTGNCDRGQDCWFLHDECRVEVSEMNFYLISPRVHIVYIEALHLLPSGLKLSIRKSLLENFVSSDMNQRLLQVHAALIETLLRKHLQLEQRSSTDTAMAFFGSQAQSSSSSSSSLAIRLEQKANSQTAAKIPRAFNVKVEQPDSRTDDELITTIKESIKAHSENRTLGVSRLGSAFSNHTGADWRMWAAPRTMRLKAFLKAHPEAFTWIDRDDDGQFLKEPQVFARFADLPGSQ